MDKKKKIMTLIGSISLFMFIFVVIFAMIDFPDWSIIAAAAIGVAIVIIGALIINRSK